MTILKFYSCSNFENSAGDIISRFKIRARIQSGFKELGLGSGLGLRT
jgi:hypothetical protein